MTYTATMMSLISVKSSGCHSVKVLSTTFGYSLVAVVTDMYCHLTYNSRGAWHTVYAMLPQIM